MTRKNDDTTLHEACYQGWREQVERLLAAGADPNERAVAGAGEWISSAGPHPRPLNCVAIAWALSEAHVEIARLLIAHGAVVDESVLCDHSLEAVGSEHDRALRGLLERARSRGGR